MIFVRQLAVLECDGLSLRKKRDFNRVFTWGLHRRRSSAFCFMLRHHQLLRSIFDPLFLRPDTRFYSNSAFPTGCPVCGASSRPLSLMVFPLSAEDTAVSIIISARCMVASLSSSMP